MIEDIYEQREYVYEQFKNETDRQRKIQQTLLELEETAGNNLNTNDLVCRRYWLSIFWLNYNNLMSYVSQNTDAKKSFHDILVPLWYFLVLIYNINTIIMATIFKTPLYLFSISSLLNILNIYI